MVVLRADHPKVLIGDNCAIHMMLPNDKKLCTATLPSDVLSNLPENVIDDILIRMPLRDVVRTSILSKKWRYNWCRIPELTLDQTLWDTTNKSIPFVTRFTDIIYHLLVLHVGPITKFILSDIAFLGNHSKIDNLPFSTFKGFSELVSLELCEVTISSEMLGNLISHIPLLEKLVLRISSILNYIQIDGPKLKSFDFTGNINILSLGKAPFLVKLSLVNTAATLKAGKHISKYFEFCPSLEHLHLDYSSLQFLAAGSGDIAAKLSSPPNCLKCLCLSDICLDESVELSFALCLIRSSPYLQDIQMKIDYSALNKLLLPVPDDVVNEIPSSFSDVTLDHLRSVKLEGITGTKTEIEFIKLLLSKSPVLVRMLIQQKIANVSAETRLKVVTEITKFPRASPKAEVDYNSGV
ncbi:F-box/FBD/LRR-repeat protein At1g13570-like [Solanum tuberosum]|uniref:F-box/FBD/LRR-repeat protein At1g13570-like n=1 Tax=Solanum tuberosum TaxID=4113 RepID=UPI0003D24582|nr:PREDICTED: F-box/FBD/LRR-repeat protein At1g13570-like [Solanum tuberosum]